MAHTRVGIIGDGQLGMMLCEAAAKLPLSTVMLATDAQGPAAVKADRVIVGAMDDEQALAALIEGCEVITYEREDVPTKAVELLREAEATGQVQCHPSLNCIEMIQDKALQKRWLADHGLATLPFLITDGSAQALHDATRELGYPLVQKALRGGFDGRGVQLLRGPEDLVNAWPGETLLEKYAGEFREIAVLVVRDQRGDTQYFGPVDMTFESGYSVLDTVSAPAAIDDDTCVTAVELAHRAIEAMNGVGVFGVEMFFLTDGSVLINEISPRVHNAGHYSMEACEHSQFELHLRAVTGLPLVGTTLKAPAAMKNVLCTPVLKAEGRTHGADQHPLPDHTVVHWYGKSPARLMRKLGHISATGATPEEALEKVDIQWQNIQEAAS